MSAAQQMLAPLSGIQQACYAWAKTLPTGFDRRLYRRAGFTTGTVASLVVRGLVVPERQDSGAVVWFADIWSEDGGETFARFGSES